MEYLCCWTGSKGWSTKTSVTPTTCRLAVVGDTGCGKTCLIFRFTRGRLPCAGEEMTTLETDEVDIERNGKEIRLMVHDTSGSADYDRVRGLTYNQVDGVVICFSLDSQESLLRVVTDWAAEVRHLCEGRPYVLVGTKKDLRDQMMRKGPEIAKQCVARKQGERTAKSVGAAAYFECCAFDNETGEKEVKRAFGRALREALNFSKKTRPG